MAIFGDELTAEVELRHGAPVQMIELKHGIFDEASLSVISVETIRGIERVTGTTLDVRRFRPNVVVRLTETRLLPGRPLGRRRPLVRRCRSRSELKCYHARRAMLDGKP